MLAAVWPLAAACATTPVTAQTACERGRSFSCSAWGDELLQQGETQQAENAYGRACEGGSLPDCVSQGKLMLERGELDGAEAPLRKGYEAELEEATWALASLHEARGELGDAEAAQRLRWEAPAIEKPDREFIFGVRMGSSREREYSLAWNLQPMAFFSRRLSLGVHLVFRDMVTEFNGAIGYLHFLSSTTVSYATLHLGGLPQEAPGQRFNVGGEFGVRWYLGDIGHLSLGAGASRGSTAYASVGLGLNSLFIELLALLAAR